MPDPDALERLEAAVRDLDERDRASLEAVQAVARAMDGLRHQMIETANAVAVVSTALAMHLDQAGVMSKDGFAETLGEAADEAERQAPGQGSGRMDLMVLRAIATHLRQEGKGWEPTVIDGGRPGEDR